jgi:hypothetical protein
MTAQDLRPDIPDNSDIPINIQNQSTDPGAFLSGFPGYRTRPGRSGYDYLDSYYEMAFVEGLLLRVLVTGKPRTRNPLYLLLGLFLFLVDTIIPAIFCVDDILNSKSIDPMTFLLFSPCIIFGVVILVNIFFCLKKPDSGQNVDQIVF